MFIKYPRNKSILLILLFSAIFFSLLAFTSTSESVHPFNKLMDPENGVNLFSGDASFTENLVTLESPPRLSIGVNLHYSSNVYMNVRAKNDIGATGWVGLGWELGYGGIICDHKNTRTHNDDDFYWINPEGIRHNIIRHKWIQLQTFQNDEPNKGAQKYDIKVSNFTISPYLDPDGTFKNIFYSGMIYIKQAGSYTFYIKANDVGRLEIATNLNYPNNYQVISSTLTEQSANYAFGTPGYYPFKVRFYWNQPNFQVDYPNFDLQISYSGPGIPGKIQIPEEVLFQPGFTSSDRVWFIEDDPYSKIEPQDINGDGIFEGWIVTEKDGTKYKYGNLNFTDNRAATSYTFCLGDYVGECLAGDPILYPYRWDLASIEDISGKEIVFKYNQTLENIHHKTWKSEDHGISYTKASYLASITMPEGNRIDFIAGETKNAKEYFDPHTLLPEPDAFMEFYEDKLLSDIKVFDMRDCLLKQYHISYQKINMSLNGNFVKSLLTQITERSAGGKQRKNLSFEYYVNNLEKIDKHNVIDFKTKPVDNPFFDINYNYGAISRKTDGFGGTVEYTYGCQKLDNVKLHEFSEVNQGSGNPDYNGEGKILLKTGILSDGNPFIIIRHGLFLEKITVYNWNGINWVDRTPPLNLNPTGQFKQGIHSIYTGKDFFCIQAYWAHPYLMGSELAAGLPSGVITVFNWNGKEWVKTINEADLKRVQIDYARDFLMLVNQNSIVTFANYTVAKAPMMHIISWDGTGWRSTYQPQRIDPNSFPLYQYGFRPFITNRYLCFRRGGGMQNTAVLNWNGIEWKPNAGDLYFHAAGAQASWDVVGSDKNIAISLIEAGATGTKIFSWNGQEWEVTYQNNPIMADGSSARIEDNYCVMLKGFPDQSQFLAQGYKSYTPPFVAKSVQVRNWDGENWILQNCFTNDKDGDPATYIPVLDLCVNGITVSCDVTTSPDFFVLSLADHCDRPEFDLPSFVVWNWIGNSWISKMGENNVGQPGNTRIQTGMNSFTAYKGLNAELDPERKGLPYLKIPVNNELETWVWKGENCNTDWCTVDKDNNFTCDLTAKGLNLPDYYDDSWVCAFPINSNNSECSAFTYEFIGDASAVKTYMKLFKKFQDSYNNQEVYSFAVIKRVIKDGITNKSVAINYSYDQGAYDTRNGTAKFNKVEIAIPGNGKIVKYFINGLDVNGQIDCIKDPDIVEGSGSALKLSRLQEGYYSALEGNIYKIETFKEGTTTNPIKENKSEYEIYHNSKWPLKVEAFWTTEERITDLKVLRRNRYQHNPENGLINQSLKSNSNGEEKIEQQKYAYEAYPLMKDLNILSDVCQSTTMGKTGGVTYVVSANATTYSDILGCSVHMPFQSYIWKATSGVPVASFTDFNFSDLTANTNWELTNSIQKYNDRGQVLQTKTPLSGPMTTIYRNDGGLPIGSIANADFYESGVFTCDYNLDEPPIPGKSVAHRYFDKANGWEKDYANTAALTVDNDTVHFGQKSIKISSGQGVMRNFKIRAGIKYLLTVWLKVTGTTDFKINIEHRTGPATVSTWPVHYSDLVDPTAVSQYSYSPAGQWRLAKIEIPAVSSGNNNWIRVTIGVVLSTASAYIDDIRFGPVNSLITTTYFDSKWQQPILSVDANNNPGQKVTYDDFGRPVELCKISKINSRGSGVDVLTQRKAYHLMNDQPFPDPKLVYKIVSRVNPVQAVQVPSGNMNNGIQIKTYTFQGNVAWYKWKFVDAGNGYYNIVSLNDLRFGLDVTGGVMGNNTMVQILEAGTGNPNQLWKVIDVGDGYYVLECKKNKAFCLHANSATVGDLTSIDICRYGVGYNQQWQIVEVAPVEP